ncbi:MAG: hypothetical protein IH899_00320 [Planctomycetes bacterium]|nr:hypothetical protein [Planctomycetota bacterium]
MEKKSILPAVWDVPQNFRDRLGRQAGKQRTMSAEDHLLIVLHRPPKPEDDERAGRFFWRKPDGTWMSSELGGGPNALKKHLDEYAALIDTLEEQDDAAKNAQDYFSVLNELVPLHRAARNMHQALQQARELVPEDAEIINFRDRSYRIERTAELLYTDTKNLLEFDIAKRAEEQAVASHQMAVSAHRLNVLVAFFFPIATLSAVFGMNLLHGYEDFPPPIPFLVVMLVGLVLGFVLKSFITNDAHQKRNS